MYGLMADNALVWFDELEDAQGAAHSEPGGPYAIVASASGKVIERGDAQPTPHAVPYLQSDAATEGTGTMPIASLVMAEDGRAYEALYLHDVTGRYSRRGA